MNEIETIRRIYAGPGGAHFHPRTWRGRGQSEFQVSQGCSVNAKQTMQNKKPTPAPKKPNNNNNTHNQGVGYLKKPVRLTNP